ncbi:MAG: hypothetical protein R3Y07_02135 [Eubacteriales bacterium]
MRENNYPHPCTDCPYKFGQIENSCTQTANYPNCTWWLYKRLLTGAEPYEVQLQAKQCITRLKIFEYQQKESKKHDKSET